MCRMIGFSASAPVRVGQFLRAVAHQAQHGCRPWGRPHGDGWGMVLATSTGWFHARSDRPIWEFPLERLADLEATSGLVHSRLASPNTPVDLTKVHPFCAVVGVRPLAFCHNGSVTNVDAMPLPKMVELPPKPIDTERYFALVQDGVAAGLDAELALAEAARSILRAGAQASSLNALLLSEEELVAFRGPVDQNYAHYYTLFTYHLGDHCVAVSTERIQDWGAGQAFEGTLVVRNGNIIAQHAWQLA